MFNWPPIHIAIFVWWMIYLIKKRQRTFELFVVSDWADYNYESSSPIIPLRFFRMEKLLNDIPRNRVKFSFIYFVTFNGRLASVKRRSEWSLLR